LSEGIRRRIALARALAVDGKLAVFDEPGDGLDAEGRTAVARALMDFSRRGVTVVILAHDSTMVHGAHIHVDLGVKPTPSMIVLDATSARSALAGA
ncbi:ABC transporter ATP-binding protein, partial [Desulfocurvibacter africanus]|uniref:ATP-binding cassette domain-containing protein n=1 Tax=Desulfocurvibacter africanus TaxID=873 RepID=UPI002FDB5E17